MNVKHLLVAPVFEHLLLMVLFSKVVGPLRGRVLLEKLVAAYDGDKVLHIPAAMRRIHSCHPGCYHETYELN